MGVMMGGVLLISVLLEGVARLVELGSLRVMDTGGTLAASGTLFPIVNVEVPGLAEEDPRLGYRLRPNIFITSRRYGAMRINRQGFRGHQVAIPKPPGMFRILALGGSTTFGVGVDDAASYPRLLEALLVHRCVPTPQRSIEVVNGGVPGYTSTQNRRRFELEWQAFQPDLVLVMDGLNDVATLPLLTPGRRSDLTASPLLASTRTTTLLSGWYRWSLSHSAFVRLLSGHLLEHNAHETHGGPSSEHTLEVVMQTVRMQLEDNLDRIAALRNVSHFHVAVVGCPGLMGDRARQYVMELTTRVVAQGGERGQRFAAAPSPNRRTHVNLGEGCRLVDAFLRRWASRHQIPYIDLNEAFARHGQLNSLYLEDGIHFTREGNVVVAEAIYEQLFGRQCHSY